MTAGSSRSSRSQRTRFSRSPWRAIWLTRTSSRRRPAGPDERVVEWLGRNEPELAVDPIILGEIRFGILLLPRGRRRSRLERWFEEGVQRLQCIPWEASTGFALGRAAGDASRAQGRAMPVKDSLIAATALAHELAVVTLNRRDFDAAGVMVVDPILE